MQKKKKKKRLVWKRNRHYGNIMVYSMLTGTCWDSGEHDMCLSVIESWWYGSSRPSRHLPTSNEAWGKAVCSHDALYPLFDRNRPRVIGEKSAMLARGVVWCMRFCVIPANSSTEIVSFHRPTGLHGTVVFGKEMLNIRKWINGSSVNSQHLHNNICGGGGGLRSPDWTMALGDPLWQMLCHIWMLSGLWTRQSQVWPAEWSKAPPPNVAIFHMNSTSTLRVSFRTR